MEFIEFITNSRLLCEYYFKEKIYNYQKEIIDTILYEQHRKTVCKASTRAGKTHAVSRAILLKAFLHKNKSIGIIAPTRDKALNLMNYVAEAIVKSPRIALATDIDIKIKNIERLKKEISRTKITFKNGSSIECKTADIGGGGFSLMGFGYDIIVLEESGEIPDEAYSKVYRMLTDHPKTLIFEIGNPWHLNHFYRSFQDTSYHKITIAWGDCVREGRIIQDAIEDQKRILTTMEFKVLFEAEFPSEAINAIFKHAWLEKAQQQYIITDHANIIYGIGVDVARGGKDKTVITVVGYDKKTLAMFYMENKIMDTNDTMQVVEAVQAMHDKYKDKKVRIGVDVIGVGSGVYDRLQQLKYPVKMFKSGQKATNIRFFNHKAHAVFSLAKFFEQGRFYNYPYKTRYTEQLLQWEFKAQVDRKIRVLDPDQNPDMKINKSPDHADSLLIACDATLLMPSAVASFKWGDLWND